VRRGSLSITLAKLALLGASLGLSFVVCEVLLRSLGYAAIYEVYSNPEMLWQHDEQLGWSHEPSSEAQYVGPRPWPIEFQSRVVINSLGLRGPEPEPLPENGIRILFLGDSMVAGFEVEYEETFCALLEGLLTQALGVPVQVINGGVRGYGTDQSYLYYRERGRLHDPDLVLLWLSENDLLDDVTIHRMRRVFGKPAFVADDSGGLRLLGSPVPIYPECSEYRVDATHEIVRVDSLPGRMLCRLQIALFNRSALFSFLTTLLPWENWGSLLQQLYYLGMPNPIPTDEANMAAAGPPITRSILSRMQDDVGARGTSFAFVGTSRVYASFAAAGVEIEPKTALVLDAIEAADPTVTQFKHDSHYTPAGHRVVANQLAELLMPILRTSDAPAP
jgi:lysophospholipase L1-like esterase